MTFIDVYRCDSSPTPTSSYYGQPKGNHSACHQLTFGTCRSPFLPDHEQQIRDSQQAYAVMFSVSLLLHLVALLSHHVKQDTELGTG